MIFFLKQAKEEEKEKEKAMSKVFDFCLIKAKERKKNCCNI